MDWDTNIFDIIYIILYPVFAMQIFLVIQFTYSIAVLRNQRNRRVRRNNQFDKLKRKAIKAYIIAMFCIVTDAIFAAIFATFYQQYFGFAYFPFSINLVVNHLAAIACFDCWKTMIWPWNLKSNRNGEVDEELYATTVFPSDIRGTISDRDAHTSIREPRSSLFN